MTTHTTPPPHADQTDQTAEPARRASRCDERGIALQTIIIMVVLLAIAGSVAAVLFNRASTETARLENSEDTFVYAIGDRLQCQSLGHDWEENAAPAAGPEMNNVKAALRAAQDVKLATASKPPGTKDGTGHYVAGWCKPRI